MKTKGFKYLMIALIAALALTVTSVYADDSARDGVAVAMAAAGVVTGMAQFDVATLKIPEPEFMELKARHGRLYVVDIKIDAEEIYQFIVCRPSRVLIEAIADSRTDIGKANDMMIKQMVVGGDISALEDGLVYSKLMKELGGIMKSGSGFLSKA